jgi:two-component system LytT family response regulator
MTAQPLIAPMTTLIIDDEPPARRRLVSLARHDARLSVIGECEDGRQALAAIRAERPDVVFLDVQMPELGGFEVLEALADEPDELLPAIVFVTAFDEFAVRAFERDALDYLLKPFLDERFTAAVDRVQRSLARDAHATHTAVARQAVTSYRAAGRYLERIAVTVGDTIVILQPADVDWIEAADNYVRLHVGAAVHRIRGSIGGLVAKLDPARFIRVHRWHAVNLDRVRAVEPWSHGELVLRLTSGARVRVSRTYASEVRAMLRNDVSPP